MNEYGEPDLFARKVADEDIAWDDFLAETQDASDALDKAEKAYWEVVGPARKRYDRRFKEITERYDNEFKNEWKAHLDSQSSMNGFVVDLLKMAASGDEDDVLDALHVKIAEDDSDQV